VEFLSLVRGLVEELPATCAVRRPTPGRPTYGRTLPCRGPGRLLP
jgi:hypothetical protein